MRGGLQGQRRVVQSSRGLRTIPAYPGTLLKAARRCSFGSREGKEPGTTPGRAGDGAGDGREARIGRAPPVEPIGGDGDRVAPPLIVATENPTGLALAPRRPALTPP